MQNFRDYFENLEEKILAPYALKSKHSLGRQFSEQPDDHRTCYQRDRDRIIHSRAFRRLKQKTQVVGVFAGDHYRTRLTHTIEVTQIGRQLARMLRLNEDVAEAIGLAHDLGHTPFGHAGEATLNELMQDCGGFEHNRQSRRVLELLEQRYPAFPGLNMSREILDGLIKHHTPYDHPGEVEDEGFIFSLESQVVNLADEIAYNSHDIDDGITAGLLDFNELYKQVSLWKEISDVNRAKYAGVTEKELHRLNISGLIHGQLVDVYTTAINNIRTMEIDSPEKVRKYYDKIVGYSPEMVDKNKQLRKFLFQNFYRHPDIESINKRGVQIITGLFDTYIKAPALIPIETSRFLQDIPQQRRVCDYIASMTDNFATETYDNLSI